jgi:hypothetical protein
MKEEIIMRQIPSLEQPISVAPLLSETVKDMLEVALNQLTVLFRTKENPHRTDEPTMQFITRLYTEQQTYIQGYRSLCEYWRKEKLNRRQKITLEKLEANITELEKANRQILSLSRHFLEDALH